VTRVHHRRFFVPVEQWSTTGVTFSPEQARQITRVLRLRAGDAVTAFDGRGREVLASLERATPAQASAQILRELPPLEAAPCQVTLAQVVPRGTAMDRILAKATELGVARIVPLEGERSVRHPPGLASRWVRIVREAAEQCGRRDAPEVLSCIPLSEFLDRHGAETPLIACSPVEGSQPLLAVCERLRGVSSLALLVGAEGGVSDAEIRRGQVHGARLATLGPRLLRAETAAITALGIVQAVLGDMDRMPQRDVTGRDRVGA
jgi:16S rRNA (uracil1498-N3)-methyltransferase